MKTTKIDWCDCTVNPVVGCPNGCKYCYAERMNKRFGWVKNWREPQFFPERLEALKSKKPKSVFIDSMSDAGCWQYEWFRAVLDATQDNSQHNYIMLSKKAERLLEMRNKYCAESGKILRNVFIGSSVTCDMDVIRNDSILRYMDFLSIEPILAPVTHIDLTLKYGNIKAVIIGAETGNRKGKVIPLKAWVDEIVKFADSYGQRVFMKESLRSLMGNEFLQDELLWRV